MNKRDLKAYSRFDGTGRIVPGSTVLRRQKPKVGKWIETQAYECCNTSQLIQRCTINESPSEDPYVTGPYFSMQKRFEGTFPYVFTLESLNINGVQYAAGQTLVINSAMDLQVGIGLDGRTYYTNTVDWINSFIPASTDVRFYDDFNTNDHPVNTIFQIIILDQNADLYCSYYKYDNLGFQLANSPQPLQPFDTLYWSSVGGVSNYNICSTL